MKLKDDALEGKKQGFKVDDDGTSRFGTRLCVPSDEGSKNEIMAKAHCTPYSIHQGGTKMYRYPRESFWWNDMKRETAKYVST
ncbi:hypothetical protein LIER_27562 [Lithospermum erythrorhizon]|uniref:Integrase zinc-binding domain-containing protein n=1 Tax=Lithospermum erythrorhizon TaxID=34254 RepID=A0AAV3RE14_LITER